MFPYRNNCACIREKKTSPRYSGFISPSVKFPSGYEETVWRVLLYDLYACEMHWLLHPLHTSHRRPDDSHKTFNIWKRERAWNYNMNKRERQRSPKIEKLRASGKVIWAKVTILTFMLFLLSKNMARNIFFLSYKKEWKKDCDFDSKGP